ncbi:hypothetical protein EJ03DRAFT_332090 [Teratosphaeria nubilosa]|uniref:Heterokaryon incompatibility domain-containing protein n=1 Tax=Teratosphaeria nubilosa TaxID=161662 RepID=A0A6G1KU27_9PEZI|nr:hypothetical protein EJ03DRAFT_332090 [Teratosphaeria nubilosa]
MLGPRSIRVALLHPADSHDAPMICDLVSASLDEEEDRTTYEGLSYTWGPPIDGRGPHSHSGRTSADH